MERLKGKVIVGLTAAIVIAAAGGYYWWQKTNVPITVGNYNLAQSDSSVVGKTGKLMVYITGAVTKPGMYEVEAGQRVLDVINLAGGVIPGADINKVNIAQSVKDGLHIAVPMTGQNVATNGTGSSTPAGEKININSAGKNELDKLPGIGPALADKIIEYRQTNGMFKDIAEIQKVPGIGEAKFKQMSAKITI